MEPPVRFPVRFETKDVQDNALTTAPHRSQSPTANAPSHAALCRPLPVCGACQTGALQERPARLRDGCSLSLPLTRSKRRVIKATCASTAVAALRLHSEGSNGAKKERISRGGQGHPAAAATNSRGDTKLCSSPWG